MPSSSLLKFAGAAFAVMLWGTGVQAQQKLLIGGTPNPEPATAMVAEHEGIFRKNGLDASFTLVAINPSIPPALLSDSIQIGIPTPTTFLQAIDGGLDFIIIAGVSDTSRSSSAIHVVVRKDSGIKEPKDLAGKKLAVPGLNAVLHVMTRHWLAQKGIDPKSVTFVEGVFPAHGDLIRSGTVDAVVTVDPFFSAIVNRGDGSSLANLSNEFPEGKPTQMFVTTRDWAGEKRFGDRRLQEVA